MKRMVIALLALTLGSVMCAHAQPQWPEENHYLVYHAGQAWYFAGSVQFADQFGNYSADLFPLYNFANPVQKDDEEILFPGVHQTWFYVELDAVVNRVVELDNQFGPQSVRVFDPKFLVLPASLYDPGEPLLHNHYLAYEADGDPVDLQVLLTDQFGEFPVTVREPVYFLNPVEMTIDGEYVPIFDDTAHLTCYRFDPVEEIVITIEVVDEFGNWLIPAFGQDCLCVPTLKYDVIATEQRSWSEIKRLYHD